MTAPRSLSSGEEASRVLAAPEGPAADGPAEPDPPLPRTSRGRSSGSAEDVASSAHGMSLSPCMLASHLIRS